MKTTIRTLLGAGLSLLVTFGSIPNAAAQTAPDPPLLFSGPVEVQTRVKPPRYTTVQHILAMDADGTISQLTTGTTDAVRPSWSSDYRYIAFVRGGMLTVMEAVGEPEARVFEVCPAWVNGLDWAPDGQSIVFCGSPDLGNSLWEVPVNPDTEEVGTPQLLWEGSYGCGDPSWSPDGSRIAFSDGVVRILDLLDGTVISSSRSSTTPAWNPTGDMIAYSAVVTDTIIKGKKTTTLNSYEICIVDPDDGSTWTRVTHLQSLSRYPAWSADGTQLVFCSDVDDRLGDSLYGITIGSDEATLLHPGGSFPSWAQ